MGGIDSRYYLFGFIFIGLVVGAMILGNKWERKPGGPGAVPLQPNLHGQNKLDPRRQAQQNFQNQFNEVQRRLKEAEKR